MRDIQNKIKIVKSLVENSLDELLPKEKTEPKILHEAMRYSIFAGGKRLRPAMCYFSAKICTNSKKDFQKIEKNLLLCCSSLEILHTYSLIHDDLPCMDDDDLRRGKPTCHKKFGQAIAILAGDALNSLSFGVLAKLKLVPQAPYQLKDFFKEFANAVGSKQLIGGQILDILSEKNKNRKDFSFENLKKIHQKKTGALIKTAVRLGAMAAQTNESNLKKLSIFAEKIGLCFQIIDDILDETQNSAQLGKTSGKDAKMGKLTYPALIGIENSQEIAKELNCQARQILKEFGGFEKQELYLLTNYLLNRIN